MSSTAVCLWAAAVRRVSSPAQLQEHNSHWAQDTDSYHTLKEQDNMFLSFRNETQMTGHFSTETASVFVITTTMILWTAVISGVHIHSQYLSRQTHRYRVNTGLAHCKTYSNYYYSIKSQKINILRESYVNMIYIIMYILKHYK